MESSVPGSHLFAWMDHTPRVGPSKVIISKVTVAGLCVFTY
jgi:hypothetical protein